MTARLSLGLSLALAAAPLPARDVELAPQAGGRFGGSMTDEATSRDLSLDGDVAFGLAVDVALAGEGRYLRVLWSRQRTEVDLPDPALEPQRLLLDYVHLGGVYRWTRGRAEPYVAAGVGATAIDAAEREVFPSGHLGAGVRWPLGERLALWVEGRGLATFETGSWRLVCGRGCVIGLSGSGFFQTEVLAGMSLRF